MIKKIRESKATKVFIWYLMIMFLLETTNSLSIYALTNGPTQPEFEAFTPISTSDMVDLSSGNLNYNIPIMDVGGYPLNLAYNTGITMDQEASWVGLGWDLNAGQITRQMRGLPDDFEGDLITYENSMKDNITVGSDFNIFATAFGIKEAKGTVGVGVKYNNHDGINFSVSRGLTYQVSDNLSVGLEMQSSSDEGVSVSPKISLDSKVKAKNNKNYDLNTSLGCSYNSRKGVESMSLSASAKTKSSALVTKQNKDGEVGLGFSGSRSLVDASFTPTKRLAMTSSNYMFSMNLEGEIWGIEPGMKFSGYYNRQGLDDSERFKQVKGFGYEKSHKAGLQDILDFNREKDRTINKYSISLPQTNYTYDIYSIQGQGISGSFRPHHGKVDYVYDNFVLDNSNALSLGGEAGGGGGVHWGFDARFTNSKSYSKLWSARNNALSRFKIDKNDQLDFEEVYYKNNGGFDVDKDKKLFDDYLGSYQAIKFNIEGDKFERNSTRDYYKGSNDVLLQRGVLARNYRVGRNQAIQKLTRKEVSKFGDKGQPSSYAKDHHTAQVRVMKEGGERYVYGRALYNITKKEATFDMSGGTPNCNTGEIDYLPGIDNSTSNRRNGDQYFNRVTTPAYAHTYLLTSVLSSDYQDLTGDGPTADDLGNYTRIIYKNTPKTYKWRIPYGKDKANYDAGLNSNPKDDKGSYSYGEKELAYIDRIETKTHIAIFETSARKDNLGVQGEDGDIDNSSVTYKLDRIKLYSKVEYDQLKENAIPIKTAHFYYDYSLCKGIENNSKNQSIQGNEIANQNGKLTLKKVYFTYQNSNMGEFTPYSFEYANNFDYNMRSYDIWSNYKKSSTNLSCDAVNSDLTNAEYGYVKQNQIEADINTSAWNLNKINLPSGGVIQVDYESDDYQFVQNKEVMQMFKVIGCGNGSFETDEFSGNGLTNAQYIYIKLDKPVEDINEFKKKYIRNIINEKIYFRFLLNMSDPAPILGDHNQLYDFVTGYAQLSDQYIISSDKTIVALGLIKVSVNGSGMENVNAPNPLGNYVNPVTRSGYNFGRSYLNNLVYGITNNMENDTPKSIILKLLSTFTNSFEVFSRPNDKLKQKGIASRFVANKSWVRLMQPDQKKLGGGCRVKEVKLFDNWNVLTGNETDSKYLQTYGQQYIYKDENGNSSGVATYEPIGSKENPLVNPIYDHNNPGLLLGAEEQNYVEGPFCESFFPSPKVTYSRVEVKNLPRKYITEDNKTKEVKKHATGKVVTEFFTTRDYPTIVDYTPVSSNYDQSTFAGSLLNLDVKTHLTMSQGFSVHTNDMDGKMKSQKVYAEGDNRAISGVDYIYYNKNVTINEPSGVLQNQVTTINENGEIKENIVGVEYEVVNDFRINNSTTETAGLQFNTAGLPLPFIFIIVPTPLPTYSHHENLLKTAVTTKVIHSSGILREKIAYDLGSVVSTKNLAFDAETGDVLLTETVNEYNDKYYSLNFPAYWNYKAMGQSSKNIDLVSGVELLGEDKYLLKNNSKVFNPTKYLIDGDEVYVYCKQIISNDEDDFPVDFKAWVVNVNNNSFELIDKYGLKINKKSLAQGSIKVIKSGYKNLQTSSMASITSMVNPIYNRTDLNGIYDTNNSSDYRIVNASAIEYNNVWPGQCECNLPLVRYNNNGQIQFEYNNNQSNTDILEVKKRSYNPYLFNILGNWRPNKSYAYLTGRNKTSDVTPRKTGFFVDFLPFYNYNSTERKWTINPSYFEKWTSASEVSQYNPYGQEVENKDALGRYSSALYGYSFKLPLAVGSNAKYSEIGFDGFEDYDSICDKKAHFNFKSSFIDNKIFISNKQSHSGRRSLRVNPKGTAKIVKKIVNCNPGTFKSTPTK